MPDLFVDTSGWGHLVDPKQAHHALAKALYRRARQQGGVLTTSYIISELVALLTSPLRIPRPQAIAFIDSLKTSPYVEVVHVDSDLDGRSWQLLSGRPDKTWSLVDCSSFVLMRERGLTEALTTDHHFEQAGFRRLLRN